MASRGAKNSGKFPLNMNRFEGGMSTDMKNGIGNAFWESECLDARSAPSQMTVLPRMDTLKNTDGTSPIAGLVLDIIQDQTGIKWAIDDIGNLYRIDTNNQTTLVGTIPERSGGSLIYNQLSDMLYIPGQQSISTYGPITGYSGTNPSIQPAWHYNVWGKSASTYNGVVNLYDVPTGTYSNHARNNLQSVGTGVGITSPSQVGAAPATIAGSGTAQWSYTNVTIPGSISETQSSKTGFIPDVEPFYSIAVYVVAKGTGDLTLTLHDTYNNAVATVTIPNASITANAYNEFVFSAPGVRSYTGAVAAPQNGVYHFHLTSSVASDTFTFRSAGSTVAVTNGGYQMNSTTADMSGIDFILFVYRMVQQNNKLHPMTLFNAQLCIGNGPYLSTYNMSQDSNPDNSTYQRSTWSMDAGYESCGIATMSQYLVVMAERRRSGGDSVSQDGMIYFWDGMSQSYNMKVHVPQGSPYSPQVFDNVLYFTVNGSLYAIAGVGQPSMKVRLISYQNGNYSGTPDNTVVYPNMMTVRNTELLIAFPGKSDNPNVRYGVYSWGNVEMVYPSSFLRSFTLDADGLPSTKRTPQNQLRMGCLVNFVDEMYLSWSIVDPDGVTHYGIDHLNNSSKPARKFSWASLIYDGGSRYKQKRLLRYKINFEPLVDGQKVYGWHSINRGKPIVSSTATSGDTQIFIELPRGRFHEAQWGFFGTNDDTVTIPEQFTGIALEIDPLTEEVVHVADDGQDDYTPPIEGEETPVGAIVGPLGTENL